MTDPTMTAITDAVAQGHAGDKAGARQTLTNLWERIGPAGDPLHRCTLAHYLADLHDDAAESLVWNVRALDAAMTLTDSRLRLHHDGLSVAGFFPSLHLNLADDLRRLGSFAAAAAHIDAARRHQDALAGDGYGSMIRRAIKEVGQAIAARVTERRAIAR